MRVMKAVIATIRLKIKSKIKIDIIKILEAEGYLKSHEITTESKFPMIRVHIRYDAKRKPIMKKLFDLVIMDEASQATEPRASGSMVGPHFRPIGFLMPRKYSTWP